MQRKSFALNEYSFARSLVKAFYILLFLQEKSVKIRRLYILFNIFNGISLPYSTCACCFIGTCIFNNISKQIQLDIQNKIFMMYEDNNLCKNI